MKYVLELEILGKSWKTEGETIDEALAKIPLNYKQIKGKGIIRLSYGKKKYESSMPIIMFKLRRIFTNKITRFIQAKNLELLLK